MKTFDFYTIHRGGRMRSVDYYEHHVHTPGCEHGAIVQCQQPTKIEAPNADTAVSQHKASHPDDFYIVGACCSLKGRVQ